MDNTKIKDLDDVYDILTIAENKIFEISVRLSDSIAIIYYSNKLEIFNIDIVNVDKIQPEYELLSSINYKQFYDYVKFLCNGCCSYRFNYEFL